jgi:hypothetical protein
LESILIEDRDKVVNLMVELFLATKEPPPPDQHVDLYVVGTLSLPVCLKAAIDKARGLDAFATAAEEAHQIKDAATAARLEEEAEAATLRAKEETEAARAATERAQLAVIVAKAKAEEEAAYHC